MNIKKAKLALKAAYKADLPIILFGAPGLGKSSAVRQFAEEAAKEYGEPFGCILFKTSTASPSEVGDLKWVTTNSEGIAEVVNAPQSWIPTEESIAKGKFPSRGCIFIDELLDGPLMIQSILQGLTLDRELGSVKLAKGWLPIGASNRRSDNAAAGRMSTALSRRFIHVTIESDVDVTVEYARSNGWYSPIAAFLRFRPALLNTFEQIKKGQGADQVFSCEASYENLSKFLLANDNLPPEIRLELISGIIGKGVAAEFHAFERIYKDLPDMKVLKDNPHTYPIPTEPSVLYAVLGSLLDGITPREFERVWPFIDRLPQEFCVSFVTDAYKITKGAIDKTKSYDEYVVKFPHTAF